MSKQPKEHGWIKDVLLLLAMEYDLKHTGTAFDSIAGKSDVEITDKRLASLGVEGDISVIV